MKATHCRVAISQLFSLVSRRWLDLRASSPLVPTSMVAPGASTRKFKSINKVIYNNLAQLEPRQVGRAYSLKNV